MLCFWRLDLDLFSAGIMIGGGTELFRKPNKAVIQKTLQRLNLIMKYSNFFPIQFYGKKLILDFNQSLTFVTK